MIYGKLEKLRDKLGPVIESNAIAKTKHFNYRYTDLPNLWNDLTKEAKKLKLFIHGYSDGRDIVVRIVDLESDGVVESRKTLSPKDTFQAEGAETTYFYRRQLIRLLGLVEKGDTEILNAPQSISDEELKQIVLQALEARKQNADISPLKVFGYLGNKNIQLTEEQEKFVRDAFGTEH